MALKILIYDNKINDYANKEGELILGNVEFHFELLGKNYATGCWGGGFWRVDKESKTLILAGKSIDFGPPKWEYFKEPPVGYEDYKITYEGKEVMISKKRRSSR